VKPPSAVTPATPPSAAPKAPEAVKAAAEAPKKETAKITLPPAAKPVPQATVNIKKPAAPAAAPSASASETPIPASAQSGDINIAFGIAAAVVALLSLGVQVWTMIG
jgi:hypothetical protein